MPEFSYDSLEEASELVKSNLKAPSSVRRDLREKALGFDRRIFKERMWNAIERAIT